MAERPESIRGRREFLRAMGRGLALGGLGLLTWMTSRKRSRSIRNETCVGNGICRGCPSIDDCGLPQALSFKRVMERDS